MPSARHSRGARLRGPGRVQRRGWSSTDSDDEVRSEIAGAVAALMAGALNSDDGPFLGACYAAEAFLSTWQDELPFGRPLAS